MLSGRIDRIFKNLAGACVYVVEPTRQNEVLRTAEGLGVRIFQIDAGRIDSKDALMRAFAQAFSFPQYFGHNWDALDECIRDLGWLKRQDFALIFEDADNLMTLDTKDFDALISTLAGATISWRAEAVVFSVILLGGPKLATAADAVIYES